MIIAGTSAALTLVLDCEEKHLTASCLLAKCLLEFDEVDVSIPFDIFCKKYLQQLEQLQTSYSQDCSKEVKMLAYTVLKTAEENNQVTRETVGTVIEQFLKHEKGN